MLAKLGERIARARSRLGWTQQELADRIAVSRTAISHFEMDLATPSERTIVLLAGLFKCEPHELVADTYYPAAKSARLPVVAARYTEVEKELALFRYALAALHHFALPVRAQVQAGLATEWHDRLLALHGACADPREQQLVVAALAELRQWAQSH